MIYATIEYLLCQESSPSLIVRKLPIKVEEKVKLELDWGLIRSSPRDHVLPLAVHWEFILVVKFFEFCCGALLHAKKLWGVF